VCTVMFLHRMSLVSWQLLDRRFLLIHQSRAGLTRSESKSAWT
jgi:hypothetical protein